MRSRLALYAGLFLTTLATLVLEVVNTRLFSVLTWYHLAFFAISLAMLGMTAAAVWVYLRPQRAGNGDTGRELVRFSVLFAVGLPLSHLVTLTIPVPVSVDIDPVDLAAIVAASVATAVPFFLSGVVVTLSLTRLPLPLGRLYGVDLAGASLGCLLAIAAMAQLDPTTLVFGLGSVAALAALAFAAGGGTRKRGLLLLACALGALAAANGLAYPRMFRVTLMKGARLPGSLLVDQWNSHSRVTARRPRRGAPTYWGPGTEVPAGLSVTQIPMRIDGGAFTVCTEFVQKPLRVVMSSGRPSRSSTVGLLTHA